MITADRHPSFTELNRRSRSLSQAARLAFLAGDLGRVRRLSRRIGRLNGCARRQARRLERARRVA